MQAILTLIINLFLVLYALFSPSLTVDTANVTGEKRDAAIRHALISARTMLAGGTRREYLESAAALIEGRIGK